MNSSAQEIRELRSKDVIPSCGRIVNLYSSSPKIPLPLCLVSRVSEHNHVRGCRQFEALLGFDPNLIHARHQGGETPFEVSKELSCVPHASDTACGTGLQFWSLDFWFPARLGFVVDDFIIDHQDDEPS